VKLGVPFLGEIPLDIKIRENSDAGTPGAEAIYKTMASSILKNFS
jgi:hypothetical protein